MPPLAGERVRSDIHLTRALIAPMVEPSPSGADLTVSPVHTVARAALKQGGIALRFPRLVRIRDDKTAEQATTVREILDMYRRRARSTQAAIPA